MIAVAYIALMVCYLTACTPYEAMYYEQVRIDHVEGYRHYYIVDTDHGRFYTSKKDFVPGKRYTIKYDVRRRIKTVY